MTTLKTTNANPDTANTFAGSFDARGTRWGQHQPTPATTASICGPHRSAKASAEPPGGAGRGARRRPSTRIARKSLSSGCTKTLFGVRADRLPAVSPRWRQFAAR